MFAGITCIAQDTGRVFLMLRSPYVNTPLTWAAPAGAVDYDEEPDEAALRELEEEAGYHGPVDIVEERVDEDLDFWHYIGWVPREFSAVMNWESSDWGWFDLDDLPEPLHPGWVDALPLIEDVVG